MLAAATGAAALYVVRHGTALGLSSGANGAAWGYNMAKGTGILNPSTINIGNAKTNLNGTYRSEGDEFAVDPDGEFHLA